LTGGFAPWGIRGKRGFTAEASTRAAVIVQGKLCLLA